MNLVRRVGAIVAAAVLAAGLLAACGNASGSKTDGVDRDATRTSAVRIEAQGCGPRTRLGMGTVIEEDLVVTAAHVVAGADRVDVVDDDDTRASAEVVMFDPDLDIAVLRPTSVIGTPAGLRSAPVQAGDVGLVAVRGVDDANELVPVKVLRTVTIRTTDIYLDAEVERPGFEIDAPIEPGDSGAMVHLADGAAGVVWARSTVNADRAWAVTLPVALLEPTARRELLDAVDTGACS